MKLKIWLVLISKECVDYLCLTHGLDNVQTSFFCRIMDNHLNRKKMKEILVSMKVTYVSGKPERPTAKKPNLPATTATSPSNYF